MSLHKIRNEIDNIDALLLDLFIKRLNLVKKVALIKKEENIPILNENREDEILRSMTSNTVEFKSETRLLFQTIMDISKSVQSYFLDND